MITGEENRIVLKSGEVKKAGYIKPASIANYKAVSVCEAKVRKFMEENAGKTYLDLDRKKERSLVRDTANALIVFDNGLPDLDFFLSDDFEFQTLEVAKSFFLSWFRIYS
jgi:hypothetical protein